MDDLFQVGESSVSNLTALNNAVSTTNDVSNTLAIELQMLNTGLDTLMVDSTGNRLTNEELADKIVALLKAFEAACLIAKGTDIREIANVMELIALNIDDINDGLRLVVSDVVALPILMNAFKSIGSSISQVAAGIIRFNSPATS
ncbi:hypothetical protein RhiJN_00701 [Ceratobasidium sp. AG-Ba]|nr:hypothetical protein RhiJN_00701 [Ceratobasidium sp. AG-Ba]QRW01736.1 hypothetical protein RhiLY_00733 [Ceratobasidium sp. AG-Ba]